jgi:hypothetical protein
MFPVKKPFDIASCEAAYEAMPNRAQVLAYGAKWELWSFFKA